MQRLKNAPLGWFYDVISNGFGGMPDYSAQIKPADRWAIAAYIRALQFSQNANEADVAAADRDQLNKPAEKGIIIPDTSLVSPAVTTPVKPVPDTTAKGEQTMSQTMVRVTPQDFAPPAVIDRMRSRSLVIGVVFSVLALGSRRVHPVGFVFAFMAVLVHVLAGAYPGSLALLMSAIHQWRQLGPSGPPHMGSLQRATGG